MNPSLRTAEKRRETRHAARGVVEVRTAGPERVEIHGQLVDVSPSGFRVTHQNQSLRAGQAVEFAYAGASGRARVIWNRIDGGQVQTGFLVL